MTLKFLCSCGKEFYMSTADESPRMTKTVQEEREKFHQLHRQCMGKQDEHFNDEDFEL